MRVLLVQDDAATASWLTDAMTRWAMTVEWTNSGIVAARLLGAAEFDVAVVDVDLADKSGSVLLFHLRSSRNPIPSIALSSQDSLANRVACFDAGAEDFLAKPFALEELQARLRALVRRSDRAEYLSIRCGPLAYDVPAGLFTLHGEPLLLSRREHALLYALIRRMDRFVPKQVLFDRAFSAHEDVNLEAVEVLMHRLRKKLGGTTIRISSSRGFGYRIEECEQQHELACALAE